MKEDNNTGDDAAPIDGSADAGDVTPVDGKSKARRKSGGVPEHKTKKLNRKASKAKMTHIDAKAGDHFFARLKGFPPWPAIICDESMLPEALLNSRPVTAIQPDGQWKEGYRDGDKKVNERVFPIMYLSTNEL